MSKAEYRIKRGFFNLEVDKGVRVLKVPGDTITLTTEEAKHHRRNIEPVEPVAKAISYEEVLADLGDDNDDDQDSNNTGVETHEDQDENDEAGGLHVYNGIADDNDDQNDDSDSSVDESSTTEVNIQFGSILPARDWSFITTKRVPLVVGIIRSAALSDLHAIKAQEQKAEGGGRPGVLKAVEARLSRMVPDTSTGSTTNTEEVKS